MYQFCPLCEFSQILGPGQIANFEWDCKGRAWEIPVLTSKHDPLSYLEKVHTNPSFLCFFPFKTLPSICSVHAKLERDPSTKAGEPASSGDHLAASIMLLKRNKFWIFRSIWGKFQTYLLMDFRWTVWDLGTWCVIPREGQPSVVDYSWPQTEETFQVLTLTPFPKDDNNPCQAGVGRWGFMHTDEACWKSGP